MANEGEFPKVDGDILYAEDINIIHNNTSYIYTGSSAWLLSGTTIASGLGSVVISTGSMSNPVHIGGTIIATGDQGNAGISLFQTSGLNINEGMLVNVVNTGGMYHYNALLGSPLAGGISIVNNFQGTNTAIRAQTRPNISNINVEDNPLVIAMTGSFNGAGSLQILYQFKVERFP